MSDSLPDPGTSRAVLIGSSSFADESLADLPAVAENLAGLRRAFMDPHLWGLPEENCVVLHQPAGRDAVLTAIHDAAAQVKDTLVVYFAGHGVISDRQNELLLALPGSDRDRRYTLLAYEDVSYEVGWQARTGRKVVILDCCYSGRASRAVLAGSTEMQGVATRAIVRGTCVLTATDGSHEAVAPVGEQYTAFTGALIKALTDGLPGPAEFLDVRDLFDFVTLYMQENGFPRPEIHDSNDGSRIALARNRAHMRAGSEPGRAETPAPRPAVPPPATVEDPLTIFRAVLSDRLSRLSGSAVGELRVLTRTVVTQLRGLARGCSIDDLARIAADRLGDPAIGAVLRAVQHVEDLRALATNVDAGPPDGPARYTLTPPAELEVPAFVLWSEDGSLPVLRRPRIVLIQDPDRELLRWLDQRSTAAEPIVVLSPSYDEDALPGGLRTLTVAEIVDDGETGPGAETILADLAVMLGADLRPPPRLGYERWFEAARRAAEQLTFTSGSTAAFTGPVIDRRRVLKLREELVRARADERRPAIKRSLSARVGRLDAGRYVLNAVVPDRAAETAIDEMSELLTRAVDSGVLPGAGLALAAVARVIDPSSSPVTRAFSEALAEPRRRSHPAIGDDDLWSRAERAGQPLVPAADLLADLQEAVKLVIDELSR